MRGAHLRGLEQVGLAIEPSVELVEQVNDALAGDVVLSDAPVLRATCLVRRRAMIWPRHITRHTAGWKRGHRIDTGLATILAGAVGATAALAAVAVGAWVQSRHRHDEGKRQAYARYLATGRQAESSLVMSADTPQRHDEISSTWGADIREAFAIVEVVGSKDAVLKGKAYAGAIRAMADPWLADRDPDVEDRRRRTMTAAREARQAFVNAARRDLNAEPLE